MSAYLSSEDMPYVLLVRDLDSIDLRGAVPEWIRKGTVLSLGDPADGASSVLVNFGGLRYVKITDTAPDEPQMVVEINGTSLLP